MRKIVTSLFNLPAKFPFTSAVIFFYELACTLFWLLILSMSKPDPSDVGRIAAGNLFLLLSLVHVFGGSLVLMAGVMAFIVELGHQKKRFKSSRAILFSTFCWVFMFLGCYPVLIVNEPIFQLQNKTRQAIEFVQYTYFASPDAKLKHELDKRSTRKILTYLQEGADINIQSSQGNTPLIMAIINQDFALATELILRGADVNQMSTSDQNALDILLSTSDWRFRDNTRSAPEKAQLALLLLSKGAYLSDSLEMECSKLLQGAVNTGSAELVKQLFIINQSRKPAQNTAEVCITNPPLSLAAKRGDNAMVSLLITHGAKVDIREPESQLTPLMTAILNKHLDTALLLISKGADINAESRMGDSVLTLALQYDADSKVIQALVKRKAKSNCRASNGQIVIIQGYSGQTCSVAY